MHGGEHIQRNAPVKGPPVPPACCHGGRLQRR
jgi:hypothetical protein